MLEYLLNRSYWIILKVLNIVGSSYKPGSDIRRRVMGSKKTLNGICVISPNSSLIKVFWSFVRKLYVALPSTHSCTDDPNPSVCAVVIRRSSLSVHSCLYNASANDCQSAHWSVSCKHANTLKIALLSFVLRGMKKGTNVSFPVYASAYTSCFASP